MTTFLNIRKLDPFFLFTNPALDQTGKSSAGFTFLENFRFNHNTVRIT